ncbi:glycosyltransferase [Phormidium sp. LEGE 05292]|uniref:glycosyltransferase family 2 protein n=1 Tax=[Phormidium] sp. LEGE 05292 TaxID=767427 RepID=UPI00187F8A9E|nr:glycosyltransferase [Phormidium sp. LEGE 05292]MBE9224572.1 glycosyltransferase [Phormidium sp. LEGE 05292]
MTLKNTKFQQIEHQNFAPPSINSVAENFNRPFWSVMIPTYNPKKYLEETLRSVIEQAPSYDQMQIEVIDNCSSEVDTEAIVKEIGKGRVAFYRQSYNVGMAGNWNTCINRARGHWIHILHDDDLVLPGFYSYLRSALEKDESAGAAFCRHIYIDYDGHWTNFSPLEMKTAGIFLNSLERFAGGVSVQCASIVVKRSVYEKLGGFDEELKYMPDNEMWKRIAVHYPIWYEPQPLACYRSNPYSVTASLFKTRLIIADGFKVIAKFNSYLPETIAPQLIEKTKEEMASLSISQIRCTIAMWDLGGAMAQIQELLRSNHSWKAIKQTIPLIVWIGIRWLRSSILPSWLKQKIRRIISRAKTQLHDIA